MYKAERSDDERIALLQLAENVDAWASVHLALARYFDGEFEDVLFRAALPDEIDHIARRGRDRDVGLSALRVGQPGTGARCAGLFALDRCAV